MNDDWLKIYSEHDLRTFFIQTPKSYYTLHFRSGAPDWHIENRSFSASCILLKNATAGAYPAALAAALKWIRKYEKHG